MTDTSAELALGTQAADAAARATVPIIAVASAPVTQAKAFVIAAGRLCGFAAASLHEATGADKDACLNMVREMLANGISGHAPTTTSATGTDQPRDADLILIMEEAAEVIQAASKILRFGPNDFHPTYHNGAPNTHALAIEIGQFLCCIDRLGLPFDVIETARTEKAKKLLIYGPDGTYLAEKRGKA